MLSFFQIKCLPFSRSFNRLTPVNFRDSSSLAPAAATMALAGLLVSGCSSSDKLDPFAGKGSPKLETTDSIPKGGGRYHLGKPYKVAGRWFKPKKDPTYDKTGTASWYGPKFHSRKTANGEWFDMNYPTAAHATLPLPSYVKVTNLSNGKAIIARLNDRGPFVGDRIIDMSRKSATLLGYKNKGKTEVRVQFVGPAPLNDQGSHLAAMNRELNRNTPLHQMIASANRASGETAATPVADTNPDSGYFVQVASFSDQQNANRARAQLQGLGPVRVSPVNGAYGTVYRVQLGPLSNQNEAQQALSRVVAAGHQDARVVNN